MNTSKPVPGRTPFESELQVRPDDIDMFQHVHSTRYLDYLLAARFDQMERCYGLSMQAFLDAGYGWVVRRTFIEYKRPLKMGDRMIVRTHIDAFYRDGVKVCFEIFKMPGRKTSSCGWCDYTLVRLDNGRAVSLPDWVLEKYVI